MLFFLFHYEMNNKYVIIQYYNNNNNNLSSELQFKMSNRIHISFGIEAREFPSERNINC